MWPKPSAAQWFYLFAAVGCHSFLGPVVGLLSTIARRQLIFLTAFLLTHSRVAAVGPHNTNTRRSRHKKRKKDFCGVKLFDCPASCGCSVATTVVVREGGGRSNCYLMMQKEQSSQQSKFGYEFRICFAASSFLSVAVSVWRVHFLRPREKFHLFVSLLPYVATIFPSNSLGGSIGFSGRLRTRFRSFYFSVCYCCFFFASSSVFISHDFGTSFVIFKAFFY